MEVHTSTWLQLSPVSICTSARVPVGVNCLYHSFVIVHTEHGQWQASFAWEKSTCLVGVGVTEQILTEISRNFGGTEHVQTVCTRLFFFFAHTRELGNEARDKYAYCTFLYAFGNLNTAEIYLQSVLTIMCTFHNIHP